MLLLDTSFLVEYEGEIVSNTIGVARRLLRSRPLEPVAISIVTVGEFAEGFENPSDVEAFFGPFSYHPVVASDRLQDGSHAGELEAATW